MSNKENKTEILNEEKNESTEIKSYVKVDTSPNKKGNKSSKKTSVSKSNSVKPIQKPVEKNEEKIAEEKEEAANVTEIKEVKETSASNEVIQIPVGRIKEVGLTAAKVLLPVAACAIVIATIVTYVGNRKSTQTTASNIEEVSESTATQTVDDEPLAENAYTDVNELMAAFYQALASGDMETVKSLRDYNDDTEILQYEKKSEFIESYDDVVCYTKPGLDSTSYFVYVTYNVKVKDIETKAPGLNAFYVYTDSDGNLIIDGNMEDDVTAAFKLVTNQDDVVDLYNRVDVDYKEAISEDAQLNDFMAELPSQIKTSVGEALAQIEAQNSAAAETAVDDAEAEEDDVQEAESEVTQNQEVSQTVRTTDTVNVRSSDSETADKIGKASVGTELERTEIKANGWSKVIFEGNEAYVKSDFLELVTADSEDNASADDTATTTTTTQEASGKVMAIINVNVRKSADQNAVKLGTAVAGNTYDLLGIEGEWYKISFNGETGYGKSEYFEKQ